MADDIVTRLRDIGDELSEDYYGTVYEAAHEIERLRDLIAQLGHSYRQLITGPESLFDARIERLFQVIEKLSAADLATRRGDDIVERLRQWSHHEDVHCASAAPCPTLTEAADEIERLRADKARYAEIVRIKDDLITEMQRRLIAHDLKVPKPKEPTL